MNNETRATTSVATNSLNVSCIWSDMLSIIIIFILYLAGNNKSWSIPIADLLLAYIIIKGVFVVFRFSVWCFTIFFQTCGLILNIVISVIWAGGMIAYYIVVLVYFFNDTNWFDEARVLWVAILLIVIEAFTIFLIILTVLCLLACLVPVTLAMEKAEK